MEAEAHLRCSQCEKVAVVAINNAPLCVSCYHTLEVARTLAFRTQAIGLNFAAAELDAFAPLGLRTPRIQVPEIPRGPVILTNIKVSNSVVGSINTGNVETIDVSISYLKTSGSDRLGDAIKNLTETIANDAAINRDIKNNLLDQIAFLSEQAVAAASNRRPGLIRAAFDAVGEVASTVTSVGGAWTVAEPLLRAIFGL